MTPLQRKFHRLIRATRTFDAGFYARNNPDLAGEEDLLAHYIVQGEAENRAPSPYFDPVWYRGQLRRVPEGHCLLAHYLTVGDGDGYQPMIGLDPAFVRARAGRRDEPALVGYVRAVEAGRPIDPNRFFAAKWYGEHNPDVVAAGVDPYWHWVHVGADEGRLPSADFNWFALRERYHLSGSNAEAFRALMARWRLLGGGEDDTGTDRTSAAERMQEEVRANHRPSPLYEHHAAPPVAGTRRACDVYAFYLTQYHRVAENDAWWGEGFTEWHNVVRGTPRFSGHYQPRVPSALGFYDLEDPRVMPRQVALARQAGLAGFAFYYYHFGDQRLLERPLDRFVSDPSLDAGFFLIWANETWSRRWDGSEAEILLEQRYPDTLPDEVAADLVRYAADPRYRRIGGRPLFVIYRAAHLPDPTGWIARFRDACRMLGEDPVIWMAQTFEDLDPRVYDLDGAMEFPPHKHSRELPLAMPQRPFGSNPALKVWDYDRFVAAALADLAEPTPYPLVRACFPSWDNDSRRQGASSVIHGSTPALFRQWLEPLVEAAEADSDDPIVCINAWNEWGEGAYLEPDRHFGYAYLNTVQAVMHPQEDAGGLKIVLVGHDAFPAGAQRLLLHLGRTLTADLGASVRFVLLRGDAGYDGLLSEYQAVAPTIVCNTHRPVDQVAAELVRDGFGAAIVNSGASAPTLKPLADAGLAVLSLIHELPAMADALGFAPDLRAAAGAVRGFVASTRSVARVIEEAGVSADAITLLPQGQYRRVARVDRDAARRALLGRDDDRAIVIGLGYGDRRKGIDLFVAAAEAACAADEPMLFVWQGDWDGTTAQALADRVEPLVAAGWLLHLPDSREIETLMAAADLFLLSSREDPLPSAAIEAWSCGLPVVALADAGGISDLIAEHADLGVLAEREEVAALLDAVRAGLALGRSETRATWATERFDWPGYVRALLGLVLAPPAVEVAIIGHNHGRFAATRCTSIAQQTLPPMRVTYHDIASTDGSAAAARHEAARLGFGFRADPPNGGHLPTTWQQIVADSDAEFLHLAEGDDWIAPDMLERCAAALQGAPDAAYAFTAVEWIDGDDRVIADYSDYPASVIGSAVDDGPIDAATLRASGMRVRNPVLSVSSVVWRRSVLADLLERERAALNTLDFAFDWLLYLRAAAAGHGAVFVPEPLCRHRQHAASFAERSDAGRHHAEIARVHALDPDPERAAERADYLASIIE